jgi:two-component system sensor histidine kinase QseC
MILSLRSRLVVGVVLGLAILLCFLCTLVYAATRYALISNFDKSLFDTAKMLSAVVQVENDDGEDDQQGHQDEKALNSVKRKIEFEFDARLTPEFNNPYGGAYYQFRDGDGTLIISSPSLASSELNLFAHVSETPRYEQCVLPDGKVGRAIGFQFIPRGDWRPSDRPFSIVIARDAGKIYDHLSFLKWLLLISSAVMVLLSVIVALFVTKAGLRPVCILADEISRVKAENLDSSHISEKYPQELLPVIRCLNSLLDRLKRSFDREKRFSSDVAHELRTPVAGIQTTIEVALSHPRELKEYQANLQTCLQIVKSIHRMIDALLSVARLESERMPLKYEYIFLKELIDDRWTSFVDRAFDRRISFENRVSRDAGCFSDKGLLSMILFNILDNAVEYSNETGRIWVEAEESTGFITLSISNTGCELNPQEAEDVFALFWRRDKSREDTGTHCGIGLAVVQRLVQALGASVKAQVKPENIFTVQLNLRTGRET